MSTPLLPTRSPEQPEALHNATSAPARYVCFGAFHLDLKKENLFKDGTRVKLQGKVYQALLALLQKPGEIVPREGYSFVGKVRYLDHPVAPQAPRPEELSPRTADVVRAEGGASFFRTAILSKWFTAAVVVLVIASMLFGAALVLYAHR